MIDSSEENTFIIEVPHLLHEQQLMQLFHMDVGVVILEPRSITVRITNFGVINIFGIDPSKAKMGDIAIKVSRNGFETRAQVWMKIHNGNRI
jgi:hypothetical protein